MNSFQRRRMIRLLPASLSFILIFVTMVNVSTGDSEVSCVVMETCILPCSFQSGPEVVIHWTQTSGEHLVHSYYNNQDQPGSQNQQFRSRTSLYEDQISKGNASLQLTGVQVQDQGQYKCSCSTIRGNKETLINLRVDAPVREVHIERIGNTLSCSSDGIYPEPGLTWSTSPSNRTLNTTTTVQQNEQLIYNISSSVVLDDGGTDVNHSCTVRTRTNWKTATLQVSNSVGGIKAGLVVATFGAALKFCLTGFA